MKQHVFGTKEIQYQSSIEILSHRKSICITWIKIPQADEIKSEIIRQVDQMYCECMCTP